MPAQTTHVAVTVGIDRGWNVRLTEPRRKPDLSRIRRRASANRHVRHERRNRRGAVSRHDRHTPLRQASCTSPQHDAAVVSRQLVICVTSNAGGQTSVCAACRQACLCHPTSTLSSRRRLRHGDQLARCRRRCRRAARVSRLGGRRPPLRPRPARPRPRPRLSRRRLRLRPILRSAGIDAQHLDLDLVADLDDLLGALDLVVGQLGDVQQAFQARLQLDEDAEVGELRDLALLDLAGVVAAGDVALPRVVGHLLEAQGDRACAPGRR